MALLKLVFLEGQRANSILLLRLHLASRHELFSHVYVQWVCNFQLVQTDTSEASIACVQLFYEQRHAPHLHTTNTHFTSSATMDREGFKAPKKRKLSVESDTYEEESQHPILGELHKQIFGSTLGCIFMQHVGLLLFRSSLIPRQFPPPVFDCLQYAKRRGKGLY